MAKQTTIFRCQECSAQYPKWAGQCLECGAWNSIGEEKKISTNKKSIDIDIVHLSEHSESFVPDRLKTNIDEFDRVVGGGIVLGSSILIYGEPGIGKSTLLIQISDKIASDSECIYISGEESVSQIQMRAKRLGITNSNVKLVSTNSMSAIKSIISQTSKPKLLIIDSIQIMSSPDISSAPGTVSQIKACTFELTDIAKTHGISIIIVGHVTKEGGIAGPKTLEHMVDTVLSFEGENIRQHRIIRAVKNRYGSTNEIGVFEMCHSGLEEITNPSNIFMSNHKEDVSGSCIFAGYEGTRSILLEVQALSVPSFMPSPRRSAIGWDSNRLSMLIAILSSSLDIKLMDKEVYLNIAGGLKIVEPAIDLAVAAAMISTCLQLKIPSSSAFFGEIGLLGELRIVNHVETRINEAKKLGFTKVVLPKCDSKEYSSYKQDMSIIELRNINDLLLYMKQHNQSHT